MERIVVSSIAELRPYIKQIMETENAGATIHIRGGPEGSAMVKFGDDDGFGGWVEEGYYGGGRPHDLDDRLPDPAEDMDGYIKLFAKGVFYGKPTKVEIRGVSLINSTKRSKIQYKRKESNRPPSGIRGLR